MQGISSPPQRKDFFIIECLPKRNITYSITTHEQFKVHIESLPKKIPFITLETTFFRLYFLKVKVHMMEGFH
jgi:hypothetical protein